MKLSKSSWHFKYIMSSTINPHQQDLLFCDHPCNTLDICTYIRYFLLTVASQFVVYGIAIFLGVCYLSGAIFTLSGSVEFGLNEYVDIAMDMFIVVSFIIGSMLIWYVTKKVISYLKLNNEEKKHSLFSMWYKSFKEKTCFILDVEE